MKCLIFFLMLPHLKPACLNILWPAIGMVFNAGRIVSVLIIVCLYIRKNKLPSKPVWYLGLLQGWLMLITFLQGLGNLYDAFIETVSIIAVALLIDFFSVYGDKLLSATLLNMEVLIYANALSILRYYPLGMYRIWTGSYRAYFLGYHNNFIAYVLPAIVIALLYMRVTGARFRPCLLIVVGCMSIVRVWSATSICGLLALGVMLLVEKTSLRSWITFLRIFLVTFSIDILISVFRVMTRIPWVAWIITSLLHKRVTLTGRTVIWDSFSRLFAASPWVGYGKGVEALSGTGYSAHNQWFQFLLEGGIVGLILFLLFNFIVGRHLAQHKNSRIVYVFYAFFVSLYIIFVADVYLSSPWLYMPYILAYHAHRFDAIPPQSVRRLRIKIKREHMS